MGFRDEISEMNRDKLTIEDIDSLIPIALEMAADMIYDKINKDIVKKYKEERDNRIRGYHVIENLHGRHEIIDKPFSNGKYILKFLNIYPHNGWTDDKRLTTGVSICADISYSSKKVIDFVDSNGRVSNRPDICIYQSRDYRSTTSRVSIDAYAVQSYIRKRFLMGNEYNYYLNDYAVALSREIAKMGARDKMEIVPKISVCDSYDGWGHTQYLDSGAFITIKSKENKCHFKEGLVFRYSAIL